VSKMNEGKGVTGNGGLCVLAILLRESGNEMLWGSELSFLELANSLEKIGTRVCAVESSPSRLISRSPRFRTFELRRIRFLPFRLLGFTVGAIRICQNHRCNVIYVHANYWFESVFVGLATSLVTRKRMFLGVLDRFKEGEDRLSTFGLLRSMLFRRPIRSLLFAFARRGAVIRAEACVTTNAIVAEYAASALHARKTVDIGRGISDVFFSHCETEVEYDACFAGRISTNKGIPELLQAWQEVVKAHPYAKLGLAGSGVEQPAMESLSRNLGILESVRFLGYFSDTESLHRFYLSAKLFVFLSRREGFARAVSEAMASGIPCIVSDLPELRAVYEGQPVYVGIGDSNALASAILRLLDDPAKRERMSRSGSLFAKRYTWERSATMLASAMQTA